MPYRFFRTTITGTLREHRAKKRSSASFEATSCLLSLRCYGNSGEVAPRISPVPGSMTRMNEGLRQTAVLRSKATHTMADRAEDRPQNQHWTRDHGLPLRLAPLQPRPQFHKRMPRRDSFLKGSCRPRPAYRESHRAHQGHQGHQGAAGFSECGIRLLWPQSAVLSRILPK
jgi:hypothetical protein